jgi:hypothetical protein
MISRSLWLATLTLLAICLFSIPTPAQVRRRSPHRGAPASSDWTFPRKGVKSVVIGGKSVYLLGNGFAATAPNRSSDGGQHVLVVISENAAEEFNRLEIEKNVPPGELLANGIFYKVCKPSAEKPVFLGTQDVALQLSPDTTVTHYLFRTASGATAHVQLSKDMQTALVILPPSGSDQDREVISDGQNTGSKGLTFEELRRYYVGKEKAEVLRDLGRPVSTYDTGFRVAWTYRKLAYDPALGRYKDVIIWFGKYGYVDMITER